MKYSVSLTDKEWDFIYCALDMLYEEYSYGYAKSSWEYKQYEKSRKIMTKLDEAEAQAKQEKQARASASKTTKLDHSAAEEIIAKKFGKLK